MGSQIIERLARIEKLLTERFAYSHDPVASKVKRDMYEEIAATIPRRTLAEVDKEPVLQCEIVNMNDNKLLGKITKARAILTIALTGEEGSGTAAALTQGNPRDVIRLLTHMEKVREETAERLLKTLEETI